MLVHPIKLMAGYVPRPSSLTSADLEEISAAIVRTGAGTGPTISQLEHA